MATRPGGELATRPLHFIWLLDCSGSMQGEKIQSLNNAIKDAIPLMRAEADQNPNAELLVRVVTFSNGAQWHVSTPTPISSFTWSDIAAEGVTDTGRALTLIADALKMPPMTERALPPVLVLVSDGGATDDYSSGLRALMDRPWGKKAVRVAIAIGDDAKLDELQKFIGHPELKPLQANNPDTLVRYIKWVSTAVVKSVSAPVSQNGATGGTTTTGPVPPVPPPPPPVGSGSDPGVVW